jgi:threonine dehydratase
MRMLASSRKSEKLSFVHPFDDPEVIAGQGTIGMEILRQHAKPIHAVFCCVGGGGLISGVAAYIKRVRPETRIIGVEASRRRRHGALAGRRQARQARSRRPVCRWRGGQVRRRGNLPPLPDVRR